MSPVVQIFSWQSVSNLGQSSGSQQAVVYVLWRQDSTFIVLVSVTKEVHAPLGAVAFLFTLAMLLRKLTPTLRIMKFCLEKLEPLLSESQ